MGRLEAGIRVVVERDSTRFAVHLIKTGRAAPRLVDVDIRKPLAKSQPPERRGEPECAQVDVL